MFSVGVVLLALERTGSATVAGFLVAAITLPSLVTAPLLGAWLDLRGRRKALMMLDQALAAAALVAIALLLGHVPDAVLVAVAFVAGLTWPLSFGGFTSLIPAIVSDELLPRANAIEATSFNLALIAGPLVAAVIAGIAGPQTTVLTEAGLTLFTLVLLVGFDALDSGPVRGASSLMQVVRDGLRSLVEVPELLGVSVAGALNLVGPGFLTVAFPYFCVEHLGASRNASGALWAAFALGSATGALALVRLQRRYKAHNIVLVSMVVFGVAMLPWVLAGSLPVAIVLIAIGSVADGPGLAATFAVRQDWAPRDLQGQIFTTAAGLKVGCFALGAAVAGPLVDAAGSRVALLAAAGVSFVAAAAGAIAGRTRRPAAAAQGPGMGKSRLEAFSDGVFAVAITLLVLEIKVPEGAGHHLAARLGEQWPSYASYAVSFFVLGVIWINHHAVFEHLARGDRTLAGLNLFLLVWIVLIPWATDLLAVYMREGGSAETTAALVYTATMTMMGVAFGALWSYASHDGRLLAHDLSPAEIRKRTRRFALGSPVYALAALVALVSAPACLAINAALAVYYALPQGGAMRAPG